MKGYIMSNLFERSKKITIVASIALALMITACSSSQGAPESVVAEYLSAMAVQDSDTMVALSTANWETNALIDADSLTNVSTELQGLECEVITSDSASADVVCNGQLQLTYNDEVRAIELNSFTYHLVKVNDAWLIDSRS